MGDRSARRRGCDEHYLGFDLRAKRSCVVWIKGAGKVQDHRRLANEPCRIRTCDTLLKRHDVACNYRRPKAKLQQPVHVDSHDLYQNSNMKRGGHTATCTNGLNTAELHPAARSGASATGFAFTDSIRVTCAEFALRSHSAWYHGTQPGSSTSENRIHGIAQLSRHRRNALSGRWESDTTGESVKKGGILDHVFLSCGPLHFPAGII